MILFDGNGNQIATIDSGKPYTGKKWVVLGDSISTTTHSPKPYHAVIAEKLGFTVMNLSAGGRTYETILAEQVPAIPEDTDLITIMSGTNDASKGWTVGAATDTGTDTFSGKIYTTLLAIQQKFPTIPIGVITPVYKGNGNTGVQKISDAITAVCKVHSVPCFDLNAGSGVLAFTDENIAHYYNDGAAATHPNNAGQAVMAAKIEPFIRSLMPL